MTIGNFADDQENTLMVVKPVNLAISYHADERTVGKALKLLQYKLIDYALTQINHSDISHPVIFNLEEFFQANGIERIVPRHYEMIRDAMMLLPERLYVQRQTDENGNEELTAYPWVTKARISEAEKECEIRFNPELQEFFSKHQKNIMYQFEKISRLKSKYAYRLYGLAKTVLNDQPQQTCQMELKEFLAYMDAKNTPSCKVRTKILDPSVEELNSSNLDIEIGYELKKTGRSFSHLILCIHSVDNCDDCKEDWQDIVEMENASDNQNTGHNPVEKIKSQIGYAFLCQQYGNDRTKEQLLALILDVITQVYTADEETCFAINKSKIPANRVAEHYQKLDEVMIQSVVDKIIASNNEIKNLRAYALTALYNEPMTMDTQNMTKEKATEKKKAPSTERPLDQDEIDAIQRMMAEVS